MLVFALEPVELDPERLAGQAAPDGDIAVVGSQVIGAGDARCVCPDACYRHKDKGQDGGDE